MICATISKKTQLLFSELFHNDITNHNKLLFWKDLFEKLWKIKTYFLSLLWFICDVIIKWVKSASPPPTNFRYRRVFHYKTDIQSSVNWRLSNSNRTLWNSGFDVPWVLALALRLVRTFKTMFLSLIHGCHMIKAH